jgi:hypothetical protein
VAARVAGQRASANAAAEAQAPDSAAPAGVGAGPSQVGAAAQVRAKGQAAGQAAARTTGNLARGVGGFLRPFRRVGGILWLEVMGVFFLVFVVAFAPTLWRVRASYAHGPDHRTFLVTAAVMALFLYLGISSFWRARRR